MSQSDEWQLASDAWMTYSRELSVLKENVDQRVWLQVLDMLAGCCGKIAVTGVGTSGIAARKVAHMLACVEQPAIYLNATDAAHGDLGFLGPQDIIILISRGGNSDELTRLLPTLQRKQVKIISVTENDQSAIAQVSALVLKTHVQQEIDSLNMLATTSIVLVLALFDAICVCLMERRGFSKEALLAVHPGGNVGIELRKQS
ncbi:SIS domain-containing protein [Serratia sp. DD3]|uniref:KpsF/GutQ family sugar-phosphate isomerase n=1 Tax=Serratia sp. DD3 TaxID=1410619 RepID=UPI0003C511FC|nr:SIS domain-containing protein [Serratia sp. DD3]KEY57681.1 arabinose 5-phosphate isomerase KpsF [Serratia sp. DD3]